MRVRSFPAIVDDRARVLITGTAPSIKSLEHKQFYGHKQNYFWRIIYGLFGEKSLDEGGYENPPEDYAERIAFLQNHRLALWDVIASCEREGSLDANIREEKVNDIPGLLEAYPNVRCVACNGGKAYDTFRKAFATTIDARRITLLKLPSSSPIPTKFMRNLDDRVTAWRIIVPYTVDGPDNS